MTGSGQTSRLWKDMQLNSQTGILETLHKLPPVLKEERVQAPKDEERNATESSQITAMIAGSSAIYRIRSMPEVFEYRQVWANGPAHQCAHGALHHAQWHTEGAWEIVRESGHRDRL